MLYSYQFINLYLAGNGWLYIEIGAYHGRLPNNDGKARNCDGAKTLWASDSKYCDPIVKISINSQEVYKTEGKKDVKDWTTYDEIYFSNQISKKSLIIFEVIDKNGGLFPDTIMFTQSINIDSLVNLNIIEDNYSKLYVNAIWKDEFRYY